MGVFGAIDAMALLISLAKIELKTCAWAESVRKRQQHGRRIMYFVSCRNGKNSKIASSKAFVFMN